MPLQTCCRFRLYIWYLIDTHGDGGKCKTTSMWYDLSFGKFTTWHSFIHIFLGQIFTFEVFHQFKIMIMFKKYELFNPHFPWKPFTNIHRCTYRVNLLSFKFYVQKANEIFRAIGNINLKHHIVSMVSFEMH